MTKMLAAALKLAERGFAVFPCWANKKEPVTKHGFKEASRDPEIIAAWWGPKGWPAANIAVATGKISNIVALDLDMKNGLNGERDLAELEKKHGRLPRTVAQRTPSWGRHLIFEWPGREVPCSVGKNGGIAPGIDVRGDGGYILVVPSYVIEPDYRGAYVAAGSGVIAPLPQWVLDLAAPLTREPRPPGYFAEIAAGVPNGRRNESLASLCGKLLRVGLTASQTLEYLRYWNQQNTPPLDDERLVKAVQNIASRELERLSR